MPAIARIRRSPLRLPTYHRIWLGLLISSLGDQFTNIALLWFVLHDAAYLRQGWLHAKLALVACLMAYHGYLVRLKNELAAGRCRRSSRWLRLFNEIPALLLIGIVILVVVKP